MADGKNILLFFTCVNLFAVALGYLCVSGGGVCSQNYNSGIISSLFDFSPNADLSASGGPQMSTQFSNATSEIVTPQSSGFNIFEGLGLLLDGLKMIIGIISLLTPIPLLDFLYSMGMPIIFVIFIAIPSVLVWVVSLMEFIRGGQW